MGRALLILTVTLASYTATAAEPDRCISALVAANAELARADRVWNSAWSPDEIRIAEQLTAAAQAQHRAALALCKAPRWFDPRIGAVPPKPFVVELRPDYVDPFEESLPAVVPVPGVPWLVDPIVAEKCPGAECPIVVVVPAQQ